MHRFPPAEWGAALAALRTRSSINEVLAVYEAGLATSGEVLDALSRHCGENPAVGDEIVRRLAQHRLEAVRGMGREIERLRRQRDEQVTDVAVIRRTSPLKPGVRLSIGRGYTAAYEPQWWLNGREGYRGTFRGFVPREAGKMPVAVVELDEEIDLSDGRGRRHKGRYALLKLLTVADWTEQEVVTVHVVDAPPEDVAAFYLGDPLATAIETHATYVIEAGDRPLEGRGRSIG